MVLLSPIAVHPDHQKSGIGQQLNCEGHLRATELGYQCSMVIGHPSYYPKFGYMTNMYGTYCGQITVSDNPGVATSTEERRQEQSDLVALRSMWEL
jgi:putative acetyltransferase